MRFHIQSLILLTLALAFFSCHKCYDASPENFMVFGSFYGECGGEECVEMFRLNESSLYEDILDHYPGADDFYKGDFATRLSTAQFESAKGLDLFVPEQLYQETAVVIGQPDAGDWGGIYFEINKDGVHRFWLLDQMESNMPYVYNDFVDRINERIMAIHH